MGPMCERCTAGGHSACLQRGARQIICHCHCSTATRGRALSAEVTAGENQRLVTRLEDLKDELDDLATPGETNTGADLFGAPVSISIGNIRGGQGAVEEGETGTPSIVYRGTTDDGTALFDDPGYTIVRDYESEAKMLRADLAAHKEAIRSLTAENVDLVQQNADLRTENNMLGKQVREPATVNERTYPPIIASALNALHNGDIVGVNGEYEDGYQDRSTLTLTFKVRV